MTNKNDYNIKNIPCYRIDPIAKDSITPYNEAKIISDSVNGLDEDDYHNKILLLISLILLLKITSHSCYFTGFIIKLH